MLIWLLIHFRFFMLWSHTYNFLFKLKFLNRTRQSFSCCQFVGGLLTGPADKWNLVADHLQSANPIFWSPRNLNIMFNKHNIENVFFFLLNIRLAHIIKLLGRPLFHCWCVVMPIYWSIVNGHHSMGSEMEIRQTHFGVFKCTTNKIFQLHDENTVYPNTQYLIKLYFWFHDKGSFSAHSFIITKPWARRKLREPFSWKSR